ncbi:hypothetical protein Q8A67_001976 [Cirrhinus molitorella]|uniref:Uncharacterized protein n=1 Tax=Cirrhinus molitorella TaxID=172907 RepID=A0AA88QA69_9TELE|nr:hypothetical protein Q8A67_001976 [Cirrhinus molitorella]
MKNKESTGISKYFTYNELKPNLLRLQLASPHRVGELSTTYPRAHNTSIAEIRPSLAVTHTETTKEIPKSQIRINCVHAPDKYKVL